MIAAAAIMKHKLFRPHNYAYGCKLSHVLLVRHNGRLHRHIGNGWFGKNYPYRWDQAASCYLDIRIAGKATNSTDLTWSQGAARLADEAIDNLSTQAECTRADESSARMSSTAFTKHRCWDSSSCGYLRRSNRKKPPHFLLMSTTTSRTAG